MSKSDFEPPVTYQGGKTRIAEEVVEVLLDQPILPGGRFYDLCCGCGAVSMELVRRGVDPKRLVMIDSGPWGTFWEQVGRGTLDVSWLERFLDRVPKNRGEIQSFVEKVASDPVDQGHVAEAFLVLQSASFGGKPVSVASGRWKVHGFRSFWSPTETSNRRSVVNPMMPMPETLLRRVKAIAAKMKGLEGRRADAAAFSYTIPQGSLVYVDPPYEGTTQGYGDSLAVLPMTYELVRRGVTVVVSEAKPHPGDEVVPVTIDRSKGGVSGRRRTAHEEFLTIFRPRAEV